MIDGLTDDLRNEVESLIVGLIASMKIGGGPHLNFERDLVRRADELLKRLDRRNG